MPYSTVFMSLFLALFFLHFVLERVLTVINARYVMAHREKRPELVAQLISDDAYARSIDYTLVRTSFGHISAAISAIFTLLFLFSGFLPAIDAWLLQFKLSDLTQGVALIGFFTVVNGILSLPLELYRTFRIEARFGFNKMTLKMFWLDRIKAAWVGAIIGLPFVYGLLLFITRSGPLWWLWAALFVIGFQFLMMVLYPLLIAPLFNKFMPMEQGALRSELEALAKKCGFAAGGIFVMDGSKRSTHSNAYFTGFGKGRRIVLFDTLVQQLESAELTAVLAHEIGHYKRRHILKTVVISSLLMLAGFYVLSLLIYWPPMYQAFGITLSNPESARAAAMGVLVFSLISGAFTFWLEPFFNSLSRKHEYEADHYAAEQTGNAAAMEHALMKLFEKNLATMTPHPIYSAYHYSHPTLIERVSALRNAATH